MIRCDRFCSALLSATAGAAVIAIALSPAPAMAQVQSYSFDLPAQDLALSLRAVARITRQQVSFNAREMRGVTAPALRGQYGAEAAIARIIEGSGLAIRRGRSGVLLIVRSTPVVASAAPMIRADGAIVGDEGAEASIVVTGSRIRGAPSASPVITITRQEITNAGQADLGEVIRSLPQNFSGGQNPTVGYGAGPSSNSNNNSASTLNLRGLGPDATLTLLNGNRLPPTASAQGIDISAIPLLAVERVEILVDGASALYGSDAVGGVANVVLRRRYDGVAASARWGASTDGGNEQQQYGLIGGLNWNGGGIVATYDYSRAGFLTARQRDYTQTMGDSASLLPRRNRHSFLVTGRSEVLAGVEFSLDALYSRNAAERTSVLVLGTRFDENGTIQDSVQQTIALTPQLNVEIGGWRLGLTGSYAADRTRIGTETYLGDSLLITGDGSYNYEGKSVEFDIEGPLATLPGGDIRLASGVGYRANTLEFTRLDTSFRSPITKTLTEFEETRHLTYLFGELFIPLVSPAQGIPFVHRLSLTGALRHERYRDIRNVTTPKLGFIYSPVPGLDFRGTWGRSFKIPTFYQQYFATGAFLRNVTGYGATFPAGSTYLAISGGNPLLDPERSRNWTLGFLLQPRALSGLSIEATYFNIRYSDRVVTPTVSYVGALTNPLFADVTIFNPSPAQIAEYIALAISPPTNSTGRPLNPATVVAIFDNRPLNATDQRIQGVDIAVNYTTTIGNDVTATFLASGSYLDSRQRLFSDQPIADLSGQVFFPPRFRGRAGATIRHADLTVSSFLNYAGGVEDARIQPAVDVDGQTSIDLIARYRISQGWARGLEFSFSVLNAFNDEPSRIRTSSTTDTPWDSTNYTPIGRFVSLAITKAW